MIHALCAGKLVKQPMAITAASGKPMAMATLVCEAGSRDRPDAALFISVLAFGDHAEWLLTHPAGDRIAVAGRLQDNEYVVKDTGEVRKGLQLVVDQVASARGAKGARKARQASAPRDDHRELTQRV